MAAGGDVLVVLGAGVMGTAIAVTAAGHGRPVVLVDDDAGARQRAATWIRGQLRHAALMGALPPGREPAEILIEPTPDAAARAVAVIEAVTENAETKAKVLAEVAALLPAGRPMTTNTSSIPVDELASALPRPQDLVGTHFMNPAYLITQVEVIRGPRTGDAALAAVTALLSGIGRHAIVVRDSPGFVTSRLLHPMINDAVRIVQAGVATAEDVDTLMQGCLGHRTGPLRTADLIGLDNLVDALDVLYRRTGDERSRPCDLLLAKVDDGDLGRKTGRGFYDYQEALS
jgi:methoxymalonate biosynthesis protein